VKLDRVGVAFDDERLVSDAGLLLPATLAGRFGLERLVNETVRLGEGVPGAALPGRKVLSLVHGMLAGAELRARALQRPPPARTDRRRR
jgi:hypothetical protein